MIYASQLCGQMNLPSLHQIQILQSRALRKITFKKHHDSANPIYEEFNILKFIKDLIYLQICLFMLQIEINKQLAASISRLKYSSENHNYTTPFLTWKLLDIPSNRIDKYGKQSARFNCIIDWNKFKKYFPDVNQDELSHFKMKTLKRSHYLSIWKTKHEKRFTNFF